MRYNPFIPNPVQTSYGWGQMPQSFYGNEAAQEILAQMPSDVPVPSEGSTAEEDAKFYSTIYKTVWGKDLEAKLASKEAQLEYLRLSVQKVPATATFLQPQIDKLTKEIQSLRLKSYYYMAVRGTLLLGGVALIGSLSYALAKLPSAIAARGE